MSYFEPHYVYVLSNPSFEGLVKIGWTSKDPEIRARELSTTGVPTPFRVEKAILVNDGPTVEKLIHDQLSAVRWSKNREFFQISVPKARQLLKGYENERLTEELYNEAVELLDEDDRYEIDKTRPLRMLESAFKLGHTRAGEALIRHILDTAETSKQMEEALPYIFALIKDGHTRGHAYYTQYLFQTKDYIEATRELRTLLEKITTPAERKSYLETFIKASRRELSNYDDDWSDRHAFHLKCLTHLTDQIDPSDLEDSQALFKLVNLYHRALNDEAEELGKKLLPIFVWADHLDAYQLAAVVHLCRLLTTVSDTQIARFYREKFFANLNYQDVVLEPAPFKEPALIALYNEANNADSALSSALEMYVERHQKVTQAKRVQPPVLFPDNVDQTSKAMVLFMNRLNRRLDRDRFIDPTYVRVHQEQIDLLKHVENSFDDVVRRQKAAVRAAEREKAIGEVQRTVDLATGIAVDLGRDLVAKGIGALFGRKKS